MEDQVFRQFHADLANLTSRATETFNQSTSMSRSDLSISDPEDEESSDPKFWLEFRTFSSGLETDTSNPDTLESEEPRFPQFAQLPPELRIKIWAYTIVPRIVVGCCLHRADEDHDGASLRARKEELQRRSTKQYAVPALLHVNQEARVEGLKHYELTFGWRISKLLSDTPTSAPPNTYFNFDLDCLLLTGDLEAYDSYGFNSPMVYFMRREDTFRIRHVACCFKELGYPEQESDQIFGCLWHVVDRFPKAKRLLLTVGEGDEERLGWGGKRVLTDGGGTNGGGLRGISGSVRAMGGEGGVGGLGEEVNVMQKIWSGWMSGTTVTNSTMADKEMLMVREEELMSFVTRQAC